MAENRRDMATLNDREPRVPSVIARSVFGLLVLVLVTAGCAAPAPTVRAVDAAAAVEQLDSRTVIDVRTPEEAAQGMVLGALNIDLQSPDFEDRIADLDRAGSYLLYCRSGNRSAQAAAIMAELGFSDVIDAGGFDALVAAGAPIEP